MVVLEHHQEKALAVFAIEEIANRLAPFRVGLGFGFPLLGAHQPLSRLGFRIVGAALRATVGKPGLVGSQFEFLSTDNAGFDRKTHPQYFIGIVNCALQLLPHMIV